MHGRRLIGVTISILKLVMLVSFAIWFTAGARAALAGIGSSVWPGQIGNPQESLTPDERTRLSEQALTHLRRSPSARNQRLRILSVKRVPPEKGAIETSIASVVVFNYSQGNATRLIMDSSNGAVLREERLRGRPQASEEERQEARQVIRADPEHARMLEAGGVLEGGFVVDAPRRQSMRDRFIQFQILTSNRLGLQRVVIVNLTNRRIAESRQR
jgi:hypothetical protein